MTPRMDEDRDETTRRLFHLALEIISLLSGEDYTIVRKTPGDGVTPIIHLQESGGRSLGPITAPPPHSPLHERNKKILELSNKMIELLSGEVPIRCQDVAVYLSMEEWEYLEGHQDRYQDVMMEELRPLTPRDFLSATSTEPHLITQSELNDLATPVESPNFFIEGDLVACNISSLMEALKRSHNPEEWKLFIDLSKQA
ncbi:gastrula zinc finger protein XlCGF66.1-like [Ranitomeya variabilis]|uniref:gastrula zinc finger protein XlCGF66.1-like n=1 Tax=Ranitomeya variabilis TaxID=490064 RepID=UPI00405774CB